MKAEDLVRKSFMDNVEKFVEKLTNKELIELCQYLLYNFYNEPNQVQKDFVDQFFGLNFYKWVQQLKTPTMFGSQLQVESDMSQIRGYLLYHQTERFAKLLKKPAKVESDNAKLKKDLAKAVEDSYEFGTFDKCDGWCNVSDVLVSHGLLTLKD